MSSSYQRGQDVTKELKLDWHTVKALDKGYMEEQLRRSPVAGPGVIGIDKIALRKGHRDRIVVSDLGRGRPIWYGGEDRSEESMDRFYRKIADRLKEYITRQGIGSDQRIFPISYTAGREVVNKAGKVVGIHLKPHDLRRHAATYTSRSGVPIEIVSKVILRHANLSTTQRYLGTVSDVQAMRWIDNLYG